MKYALVVAFAMGLTACVSAQSASPPPHDKADQGQMMGKRMGGKPMMGMARHTEGTLASLKAELKITAAQAKAWRTFAAAYRDFAASKPHMPMKNSDMKCCGMMGEDKHTGSDAKDGDEHAGSDAKDQDEHAGADATDRNEHAGSDAKDRDEHAGSGAEVQDEHAGSGAEDQDAHAGSVVKRMEMHMKMMQSRLKALRKLNAALKPLYASLTKQQKKTADQVLPKFMKMGHMM